MFSFYEADYNSDIMQKIYEFRCKILCEELKYFDYKDYPEKKEIDKYDKYARHYVAFDGDNLIAYTRFIYHSKVGYPVLDHMEIFKEYENLNKDKISEISRIFIKREYRGYKTSKYIINRFLRDFIYKRAKEEGIDCFLGALQKNFLRFLQKIKVPYYPIGKEQEYGGKRYPAMMKIEDYEKLNPDLKILEQIS